MSKKIVPPPYREFLISIIGKNVTENYGEFDFRMGTVVMFSFF